MQSLRRLASRTSSNIWLHAALSKTGLFRCRCCCCYCHCRSFVFVSPECRRRRRHHISCRRLSMPCPIANELQFYLKEYKRCKTIYSNCQFCRAKIWLNCLCRGRFDGCVECVAKIVCARNLHVNENRKHEQHTALTHTRIKAAAIASHLFPLRCLAFDRSQLVA